MANPFGHLELATGDVAKAKDFYGEMFGWSFEDTDMGGGMMYTMIRPGEGPGGGMMQTQPGMPTAWTAYVIVDDVERATQQAKTLGATVIRDVTPIPEYGAFSIIADPTGAVFGMFSGTGGNGDA